MFTVLACMKAVGDLSCSSMILEKVMVGRTVVLGKGLGNDLVGCEGMMIMQE